MTCCSRRTLVTLILCLAISAPAQTFTKLADFQGTNGDYPLSPLVQGMDGNLYGTTFYGGETGKMYGTVFDITPAGQVTVLYSFCTQPQCSDGSRPDAALLLAPDGNFYGTTLLGGSFDDAGTVYRVTPAGDLARLHSFGGSNSADGMSPQAPLVQGIDGNFYGAAFYGGNPNCSFNLIGCGVIFKMSPNGRLVTLYRFCSQASCPDGAYPAAGLIQATDGDFYGTTSDPVICNDYSKPCGTVFKINSTGRLTTLYRFCTQNNCTDGANPVASLVQASDGNFYGTTFGDGFTYFGTVFRISPAGALKTLYIFCSQNCTDGAFPSGLIQATDGSFYGTTLNGGMFGQGTIFRMSPDGESTTLYNFCNQQNCPDGAQPWAGLVQRTDGKFYGVASTGGNGPCTNNDIPGCGTAFSLDVGLGPFVRLVRTAGRTGQTGGILGQGLTGTTGVSINGIPADFHIVNDTYLTATVPQGATTGYVTVTTPGGVLTSNVPFHVIR